MDYYSDYKKFLQETADEVGRLISYKQNLRRFRQQARLFIKQYETHCDAVEQWEKKAATDPRLRDRSKGPPEPGCQWARPLGISNGRIVLEHGYWTPSEGQLPPDPFKWFSGPPVVIGARHEAEQHYHEEVMLPHKEILLPCCYVLLITVHDNMCPPGFPIISEGIWSQEEGDSWYDETLGGVLRHAVFRDIHGNYKLRFRRKIEWSLEKVKADLPEKPAGTEQKTKKRNKGMLNQQVGELLKSSLSDISAKEIAKTLNENYASVYKSTSESAVSKTENWKRRYKKKKSRRKK